MDVAFQRHFANQLEQVRVRDTINKRVWDYVYQFGHRAKKSENKTTFAYFAKSKTIEKDDPEILAEKGNMSHTHTLNFLRLAQLAQQLLAEVGVGKSVTTQRSDAAHR